MNRRPTAGAPDWRELPVLVTGGAGFIGSHLVDALAEAGARVRVLDDLSTGRRENLARRAGAIELLEGDVRDLATCRRAAEGVSLVFHQAALGSVPRSMADPATTIAVNVSGTANVFAAARDAGVARVVYASSSSVYGTSDRLPKREGEEGRALSPYALSKAMDEELAEVFTAAFGQELVGLRYFNVYGPRQSPEGPYAAVVPRFFRAALAGEAPRIHGDGGQSRDFTYVADAVRANLLAAAAPRQACGRSFNVAAGRRTTVLELAEAIRALAGPCPPPVHEPARPGDVRHSQADPTAAREALGFTAEVDLAEGLRRTAEHYRRAAPGAATAFAGGPEQASKGPEQTSEGPEQTSEGPEQTSKGPEQASKGSEQASKGPEQASKGPEQASKGPEQASLSPRPGGEGRGEGGAR